ncbi:MAG: protein-methionine-sulfoxide reductase catalytic subunit MsrP [Rhodobiaceae bacterium]|nr:protein-methionine-sulfoxide reductase catalytic subunit MsrP [Rhodobiaceae bacterium]
MLIKNRRRWEISENDVTSESIFFNRRRFLKTSGLLVAGIGTGLVAGCDDGAEAETVSEALSDPNAARYPAPRNANFTLTREISREEVTSRYNNFYEFGSHKRISGAAQALEIRPWQVVIDGDVDEVLTLDADDLISRMPLEERLYRHRCVEAWAMAVPWTGFPVAELVKLANIKSGVRYLRMETFHNPDVATGQNQFWYPWPYVEGLTIEEATNDLAFMVTGVYGKPLPKQFGAPLRLAVPWKYGFKSIKSIVRFTFTKDRPVSFWQDLNAAEYGFWANVNPEVPHPRWSQATEELLGTGKRVPTQLFNGYAEEVAHLYTGNETMLYR